MFSRQFSWPGVPVTVATLGDKRSGRTGSERLSVSLSLILFFHFYLFICLFWFFFRGEFFTLTLRRLSDTTRCWLDDFKRRCHLFVVFFASWRLKSFVLLEPDWFLSDGEISWEENAFSPAAGECDGSASSLHTSRCFLLSVNICRNIWPVSDYR